MTNCNQANIDEICRDLYGETRDFFEKNEIVPRFGFKILNGTPIKNAEILFVGYQPGGGEKDAKIEIAKGTDRSWLTVCEYATETWALAPKMRSIFGVERLKRCVGTNAIFLRYPNEGQYRRDIGSKRRDVEKFCTEKVKIIIETINPRQIVTIGFKALEMFGPTKPQLKNGTKTIMKSGKIAGRAASGIIHLTGARPSKSDLAQLEAYFTSPIM